MNIKTLMRMSSYFLSTLPLFVITRQLHKTSMISAVPGDNS